MSKLLCWLGFHKIDKEDGWEQYNEDEKYLYTIYYCRKCNKRIVKDE